MVHDVMQVSKKRGEANETISKQLLVKWDAYERTVQLSAEDGDDEATTAKSSRPALVYLAAKPSEFLDSFGDALHDDLCRAQER